MSSTGKSRNKNRQIVKNKIKQETPEIVLEALAKIAYAGDSDDSDDYTIRKFRQMSHTI